MVKVWKMEDYLEFKSLRSACFRHSRTGRANYICEVQNNSKKNVKYFWEYVDNLSKNTSFPQEIFFGGTTLCGGKRICNIFAKNFVSLSYS